jgi:hypothetical protein
VDAAPADTLSLVIGLIVVPEGLTDAAILAEGQFFITGVPDSATCSTGARIGPGPGPVEHGESECQR